MKNLFIIIILSISLFVIGCGGSSGGGSNSAALSTQAINDTTPDTPAPVSPPSLPADSSIKLAANLGGNLYFLESKNLEYVDSGAILKAGSALYSVDDNLVQYDASGDPEGVTALAMTPTQIKSTSAGVFACDEYTEQEAYDLGGLYRKYSEIYQDDVIISAWYNNQYECRDIVAAHDSVFVINHHGGYETISGPIVDPIHVEDDQFIIYGRDSFAQTVVINGVIESYDTNNILSAKQWIRYGSLHYSENGYTWSVATGLTELATALSDFQEYPYPVPLGDMPYGQSPVLLKVGIYGNKLYYMECNTGWLFIYDPAADTLERPYRPYVGSGYRSFGITKRDELNPTLTDNLFYYRDSGVIKEMDLDTGFVDIFYNGDGETMEF